MAVAAQQATRDSADALAMVHDMLGRVADKWTLIVIDALVEGGTMRFTQLRQRVGRISQKVLTKTLRELERDGLVTRTVYPVVPPRVEYALTPLGESLAEALCSVWLWVEAHGETVARARQGFDRVHRKPEGGPARS
jgi:DNA-binding HxlR family transcriptional regulator